jgi:hypothetical protein
VRIPYDRVKTANYSVIALEFFGSQVST